MKKNTPSTGKTTKPAASRTGAKGKARPKPPDSGGGTRPDELAEVLTEAVFWVDLDWIVTRANAAATELSEAASEPPTGKALWHAAPFLRDSACEKPLCDAAAARAPFETEAYFAPLQRWLEIRLFPAGQGNALLIRDVTARRNRASRENEHTAQLAQATDAGFFEKLVTRLSFVTRAECVVIGRFLQVLPQMARIIAIRDATDRHEPFEIAVEGTPLQELLTDDFCVIRADTRAKYPTFRWEPAGGISGFIGVALRSQEGELLGFIATLHTESIADSQSVLDACRLYAERAAGELSRQVAIERLKRSEERFKSLARATTDAVWDCDLTTGAIWRSDAFDHFIGGHGSDHLMPPSGLHDRIHADDRQRVVTSLRAAVEGSDVYWQDEFRLEKDDGACAAILDRAMIIRDASGKAVRIVGGMTDISDRIEIASRLREQAELLDRASDAIMVCDLNHRIQYWNRGAERLYGWTAQEAVGLSVLELFENSRNDIQVAMGQAREREECSAEITKRDKEGRNHVLSSRWTLIRGASGEPRAFLNIDTDITEKKQLEAQFLRTQRLESIGVLAGGIAHDLNNMLTPITMAVDVLQRMHPEGDTARLVESIDSCARRGADLVRQVLGFARGVEGKRLIVNPAFVAGDIAKIARDTFPKNIRVFLNCTRDPWLVTGDATQLHQILLNLCVNARDAMPAGGELRIKVENITIEEPTQSVLGVVEPGDYAAMTVSDTGSGIPEAIRDKIFDPFFSTKPPGKGTGLGLSTLLAILKSHCGALTMTTESGEGSSFCVLLPAERRKGAKTDFAVDSDLPRGHGELLLVVDDEAYIRTIAKQTLEGYGYEVITAGDGAEALAAYLEAAPRVALVVTDLMMPVMDGSALIRALRRINPVLPLIAASGMDAEAMTDRARAAGATDFVAKPYSAEDLLTRIDALVSKKR
ncbi:MAG: PAS domain S-box protein [Opitutaceae bacterium]